MSYQEIRFNLPLPVNDTGQVLEHMEGTWGNLRPDAFDELGGVRKDAVPKLAEAWVKACNSALGGYAIIQRAITEQVINGALNDLEMYDALSKAFGIEGQPNELIIQARNAFEALVNPSLLPSVTQEEVSAAEHLVAGLDGLYQVRGLAGFANK